MSAEPESLLARWSRRKRAAARAKEQPAETPVSAVPAARPLNDATEATARSASLPAPAPLSDPAATSEVPLPPIESLNGLDSDYQAFFQQPVAEDIRHAALKKLFADPHFNQMDMLDVYVDDYTQFEPLPAAMRLRLPSARAFLLDSERAALEAAEASSDAAADAAEHVVSASGDGGDAMTANTGGLKPIRNADEANVELTLATAAAPGATPPNAQSDPEKSVDVASSSVIAGKAIARDPSSS